MAVPLCPIQGVRCGKAASIGAVIGKAMSPLCDREGLVLVPPEPAACSPFSRVLYGCEGDPV